ncbi:hypothetical protein NEOLI_002303 [Neolecta irregularis DAH-3]|uniref:Uncharacterized protein n=1 Tax=Neolecta irregularis (strain DAH-3) TaxID=1198029 RepID=A0A1U7LR90_NEOID|nr:hypothetical protein NEOLI_002303 [Neolecta irregularis DAH-3]|eukprot:OLL25190.1 hypothetical protein NEOLI_002303 [Neolecta irregularis DAH-3]
MNLPFDEHSTFSLIFARVNLFRGSKLLMIMLIPV